MAEERIYTIPLRASWLKSPRVKRANRSVRTIEAFMERHMKAESVKISQGINKTLWSRGAESPPGKIRVKATKEGNVVTVTLPDEKLPVKAEKPKAEAKKGETKIEAPIEEEKPKETKENSAIKEEKPKESKIASKRVDKPQAKTDKKK